MKTSIVGSDAVGVVYQFHPTHKINGTVFYCAEHYAMLRSLGANVRLYFVGISENDLAYVQQLFAEKYTVPIGITPIDRVTDIYKLGLSKTLILDVRTFYALKEFLTGDVHVFSNETHVKWRYANDRTVTYYGSYYYQRYDVFNRLKLNFGIFKPITSKKHQVLVSSPSPEIATARKREYEQRFERPTFIKSNTIGRGNIHELVDHIHYVHTGLDTNNRIIPEAFFYNTPVTIEESFGCDCCGPLDSVRMRYDDIIANGLDNYKLTENDRMIQACLPSHN